jgi:hypothetical protein
MKWRDQPCRLWISLLFILRSVGSSPAEKKIVTGALQGDQYKFFHEHGVVTLEEPQGLRKRVLDFVDSSEDQKLLGFRSAMPLRELAMS